MVEFKVNGRTHTFDDIIRRAKDSGKFHFKVQTNDPDIAVDCTVYGITEWTISKADTSKAIMRGSMASVMAVILKWNPSYFLFPKNAYVEIFGWKIEPLEDEELEKRISSLEKYYSQYHEYLDEINFRDSIKNPMKRSHDDFLNLVKEYKRYNRRMLNK